MRTLIFIPLLSLLSFFFIGCAGTSGDGIRTLSYVYQEGSGLTSISLFDLGAEGARGTVRRSGSGSKTINLSSSEFNNLWRGLNERSIASYVNTTHLQKINGRENFIVTKGYISEDTTTGGTTRTYAVPRSQAPERLRNWVYRIQSVADR